MRALAIALLLASCGVPPGDVDASIDAGPRSLTLGTGAESFTAIEEGATLELARGCQGLQHVWIALRTTGLDPRGIRIDLTLARASDGVVVSDPFAVRLSFGEGPSGASDLAGLTLVVPVPDEALDEALVLRGTVADREGRTASATRDVHVVWGTEVCR